MRVRKCCVPNCTYRGKERFRLPNPRKDEVMLRKWIQIIGGDLRNMDLNDIYNLKRICPGHFTNYCFNPGLKGLLRIAVPTLCIPEASITTTVVSTDTAYEVSTYATDPKGAELMYGDFEGSPPRKKQAMDSDLPIISYEDTPSCSGMRMPVKRIEMDPALHNVSYEDTPSRFPGARTPVKQIAMDSDVHTPPHEALPSTSGMRTPVKQIGSLSLLRKIGSSKVIELTPKASRIKEIKIYIIEIKYIYNKNIIIKIKEIKIYISCLFCSLLPRK